MASLVYLGNSNLKRVIVFSVGKPLLLIKRFLISSVYGFDFINVTVVNYYKIEILIGDPPGLCT